MTKLPQHFVKQRIALGMTGAPAATCSLDSVHDTKALQNGMSRSGARHI